MAKSVLVVLSATIVSILLSGCGGTGSPPNPSQPTGFVQSAKAVGPDGVRNLVYVSDQLQKAVLAFPAGERAMNPSPVQTLNLGVIPEGVWVDRSGVLYVALSGESPSQNGKIEEFEPGTTTPFVTITDGISVPQSLVVDAEGTLYVDQIFDTSVQILEYPAGKTSPATTLQITDKGEPVAGGLTLDDRDNIYVHVFFIDDPPSRVFRFRAGKTVARDLQLIGLGNATGLTSDANGNLYVADSAAGISVYAPGQRQPARKIAPPPSNSFAGFVATRNGKLYVAQENPDPSGSSLLEYAAGGSQPVNVLSGHLQAPVDAALKSAAF
jgi:sugar lactone lactonase YvrE